MKYITIISFLFLLGCVQSVKSPLQIKYDKSQKESCEKDCKEVGRSVKNYRHPWYNCVCNDEGK